MPMNTNHFNFLVAVLGADGASALQKASDRSEELGGALIPRAILSWLNVATKYDYEGEVPGVTDTYVSFTKSQNGFSGSVDLHGERYSFKDASIFHLAASVATAIDVNDDVVPVGVRGSEIEKLGRSVDLLAKSRFLADALAKAEKEKVDSKGLSYDCPGKDECANIDCHDHVLEKGKDSHGGAASKGSAASQIAPAMPLPPTAVQPEQPRITSKVPKLPGTAQPPKVIKVELTKTEANRKCSMCAQPQFSGDTFKGCLCLRALAKSSKVVGVEEDFYKIDLDTSDWGKEEVLVLLECIGRIK